MPFASIKVTEAANLPVRDEKAAARVALVTGGNKGIGRVIVAGLARQGFTVYLGPGSRARHGSGHRAEWHWLCTIRAA
jgi:hypothetical protein